jgi:ABC-type phosphate/phosphonate transport system substrate-binding protein
VAQSVAGHCPACLAGLALSAEEELPEGRRDVDGGNRQFGDYLLGRQIGAGGMGVVYEARRVDDSRRVALKLIRDLHSASPALLRRFTIEAEAVVRLEHPHIVRIHEAGECDGHPFFSMDYVEGEGLDVLIARGAFDLKRSANAPARQHDIARLMVRIARAVEHAHERGVLHRDLKPANILIDAAGEPRLTDFGLAKILQPNAEQTTPPALTTSGVAPGTPSYMAPEQVAGGEAGRAADIYALGAVLYATIAGRPPFQGVTPLDLFQQITRQAPARLRVFQPAVDAGLERICLKCLEKDPRHRYGSAGALADDLERWAQGRRIHARPPGAIHRTSQWIRRNPVGTALIASLCLGLFVSLALLKVVDGQRREIEADRDQTFDEGMQKVSQLWRDPATRSVMISARELAILAERSPATLRGARYQLTLGVSANDSPSSMAQRYARLLGHIQDGMSHHLGEKTIFHLRLMKRFNPNAETLAQGEADFLVLSAAEFIQARERNPDVTLVARTSGSREAVVFARTNSGIAQLSDLRGRTFVLPDARLSVAIQTRARLFDAGLRKRDFRSCASITDEGASDSGSASIAETVDHVLGGKADAGVTYRAQFERYRHLGLEALDAFPEAPGILAARAGIDHRLTAALHEVLRASGTRPWPESKFVAASEGSAGPAVPELGALLQAIGQAAAFEE